MSTAKKYRNRLTQITKDKNLGGSHVLCAQQTLEWLDQNPDQVPTLSVTLDALAAAYESAEVVDEYSKGDVMISKSDTGYYVWTASAAVPVIDTESIRRLSRAPEPTNAEKIAELLHNCTGDVRYDAESIAAYLDENGVKVGEDSE